MAKHSLLNDENTVEINGTTFKQQNPANYPTRYHCHTKLENQELETILRETGDGNLHRTTTFYNDYGHITNQITEQIPMENQELTQKNAKTIVNNYLINKAHKEKNTA